MNNWGSNSPFKYTPKSEAKSSKQDIPKQSSTMANTQQQQQYDYFLILDFEAVWHPDYKWPAEIIEFPTVLINAATLQKESEFHHYVKTRENKFLNDFCKQQTGIQQEWVDNGMYLADVIQDFENWFTQNKLHDKRLIFVTCGDWDLGTMCARENIQVPEYFKSYFNIKKLFSHFYKKQKVDGMKSMLNILQLGLEGHHHSGIDDTRNIGRILVKMIQDGCIVEPVTTYFGEKKKKKKKGPTNHNNTLNNNSNK